MSLSHLGNAMRRGRVCYAVSVKKAAADCGIPPLELRRIEQGACSPSDAVLDYYARSFRMDMDELTNARTSSPRLIKDTGGRTK